MHCSKNKRSNLSSLPERFVTCTIGLKRDLGLNHEVMTKLTFKTTKRKKYRNKGRIQS